MGLHLKYTHTHPFCLSMDWEIEKYSILPWTSMVDYGLKSSMKRPSIHRGSIWDNDNDG